MENNILPVGFGGITGCVKGISIGFITAGALIQVIIYAAVGAVVGYFIKILLDYIITKYKNHK